MARSRPCRSPEWEYKPLDVRKVAFALMAAYLDGARTLSIDRLDEAGPLKVRGINRSPIVRFTQDGAAAFSTCLRPEDMGVGHARLGKLRLGRICARLRCGRWQRRWKIRARWPALKCREAQ